MALTDRFRAQHAVLVGIVTEMSALLDVELLAQDASRVRRLLSSLTGKLIVHLAIEDQSLYPVLLDGDDQKAKALAQQFKDEMSVIKAAFEKYVKKWPTAAAIQAEAAEFVRDTQVVFAALKERVEKENNELYPMIDSVPESKAAA